MQILESSKFEFTALFQLSKSVNTFSVGYLVESRIEKIKDKNQEPLTRKFPIPEFDKCFSFASEF